MVVSAQQVANGPPVSPIGRIRLYSPEEWETFTNEWAFYFFKGKAVERFTGAGDKGVDIAVFDPAQNFQGVWDGYQCKHYGDPLDRPMFTLNWARCCVSFSGDYATPRSHTFVAPRGIGTKLNNLLMNPDKLKTELIANWRQTLPNRNHQHSEYSAGGQTTLRM